MKKNYILISGMILLAILLCIVLLNVLLFGLAIFNSVNAFNGTGSDSTVTDYDGNVYHLVTIGSQVWTRENLRSLHYSDGTVIPNVLSYNNNDSLAGIYGRLYDWNSTMRNSTNQGVQGVCPAGFHVPTDSEWTVLGNYLGGNSIAGGKLKETDTTHWYSPNTGATNSSGFTALGGGEWENGIYQYMKMAGVFWSSTQANTTQAKYRYLQHNSIALGIFTWNKNLAYSVRCIKDNIVNPNLLNGPDDIVFDIKHNRILVSNWAGNNIVAVDSNGTQTEFASGIINCHGLEIFCDTLYASGINSIYCINLNTGYKFRTINVPGANHLGPVTLDTVSLNLYVSDWGSNKIFRVNLVSSSTFVLVNSGIVNTPMGLLIDNNNNRLILLSYGENIPIRSVNMNSGAVSVIKPTSLSNLDAIARDNSGNIYFSSYNLGNVYRIDSGFAGSPVIISSNYSGPSGLGYNRRENQLGITNYDSNKISILDLNSISIKETNNIAETFDLGQNYPNPFNNSTKITFTAYYPGKAILNIYDISGKLVSTLMNRNIIRGKYEILFNADGLSSGIYFYRLVVTGKNSKKEQLTKSMLLIK